MAHALTPTHPFPLLFLDTCAPRDSHRLAAIVSCSAYMSSPAHIELILSEKEVQVKHNEVQIKKTDFRLPSCLNNCLMVFIEVLDTKRTYQTRTDN